MSAAELPLWRQTVVALLLSIGLLVSALGVAGMLRMPDLYNRIHAAGKGVAVGVVSILAAGVFLGDPALALRCLVTAAFVLLTVPLASHVLARAHYHQERSARDAGADAPPVPDPPGAASPEEEG